MPEIKIKKFYVKDKCENPFLIRFPNLSILDFFIESEEEYDIQEILEYFRNKELHSKYMDLIDIMNDKINIKYYRS